MLKRIVLSLILGLSLNSATMGQILEGEWQLISAELTLGSNTFPTFNAETHEMIKIFTATHFAFVSKGPNRTNFSSYSLTSGEKVVAFDNFGGGAGRYEFDGLNYVEHVDFSIYPNYEGKSLSFKVTIVEDILIQEGHYPIVSLGLGEEDGYVREIYKRIQ